MRSVLEVFVLRSCVLQSNDTGQVEYDPAGTMMAQDIPVVAGRLHIKIIFEDARRSTEYRSLQASGTSAHFARRPVHTS